MMRPLPAARAGFAPVSALDAMAYACSIQAYLQSMVKASLHLSPEARETQLRAAHAQAARGLRSAVELWMKAIGASGERLRTLMEAGVALEASLEASVRPEDVEQAHSAYHVSVLTVLCTVQPAHARILSVLSIRLRREGGARSRLFAAVRAAGDIDGVTKAYADFGAAVLSEAEQAFPADSAVQDGELAQALARVLMLANMGGGPGGADAGG